MLRIGLTGDLGSGKSTVSKMLADRGAIILSSDEMGRAMMQPGQPAFAEIVACFGISVLAPDGTLDRRRLAAVAFDPAEPRIEELNAIIHPAVIAAQARQLAGLEIERPDAIAVVESALIFSTRYAPDGAWRDRFDRIFLVTAPEEQKIARFVARAAAGREISPEERVALEADARQRLALQHTEEHAAECLVLRNDGGLEELEKVVDAAWSEIKRFLYSKELRGK
jgi:dephospho-CoA kinase